MPKPEILSLCIRNPNQLVIKDSVPEQEEGFDTDVIESIWSQMSEADVSSRLASLIIDDDDDEDEE